MSNNQTLISQIGEFNFKELNLINSKVGGAQSDYLRAVGDLRGTRSFETFFCKSLLKEKWMPHLS